MKSTIAVVFFAICTFAFSAEGILSRTKRKKPDNKTTVTHYSTIETSPYVALVHHPYSFYGQNYCGATIISRYWLLSSAECFLRSDLKSIQYVNLENFTIITGVNKVRRDFVESRENSPNENNIIKRHNFHEIREIRLSKSTKTMSPSEIMVLVKLKSPIDFDDTQKAVSIGRPIDKPKNGESVTLFGFLTNDWKREYIDDLAKTSISITDDCFKNCSSTFTEDREYKKIVFCTTDYKDQDGKVYEFFTGSPVIFHEKLVGFVPNTFYNVTDKVSSHYVLTINILEKYDWILDNIDARIPFSGKMY